MEVHSNHIKGRLFRSRRPSVTILPFIVTTVASTDVSHYIAELA